MWIDVGQPDERDVRKACGRANQVVVVSYGGRTTDMWWAENRQQFGRLGNLTVVNLPLEASQALARLAAALDTGVEGPELEDPPMSSAAVVGNRLYPDGAGWQCLIPGLALRTALGSA